MKKEIKNKYFKKIEVHNGILDYSNSVEFYKQYLETPRLDWQNEMRRPVRHNIFVAMCATHAKYGQNPQHLIEKVKEEGGKVYFWSDLHLFHHNIIRYTSRPFETTDHMNQTMIGNYWSIVTEKDLVIFGGDVGFGEIEPIQQMLKVLPGKKVLILGNHDFDKNKCIFRNYHVFDVTTMAFSFQKEVNEKIFNVLVTHYPIHHEALPENTINIHGHIHQHLPGIRNINMSVEHTAFAPIEMDAKIEDLINQITLRKEK